MSAPIYEFKMYLLQSQLGLDSNIVKRLKRFCDFASIFYPPHWFQCPLASEAAVNDLNFYKSLIDYVNVDKQVAEAAMRACLRHRWYLTEELIPLALCSRKLSDAELEKLGFSIYRKYQHHVAIIERKAGAPLTPEKPRFPEITPDTSVSDLVGERSVIVFQRLKLSAYDVSFLKYARSKWCEFEGWAKLNQFANGLEVVNDIAERGVRLMEEYKDVLTNDEEQRKKILHCVEETKKIYPDFKKSTLAKNN